MVRKAPYFYHTAITSCIIFALNSSIHASEQPNFLEEIVVSAQKTEKPLQETSNAATVLSQHMLEEAGIWSISGLEDGLVPSLRIQPFQATPSSLVMSIRGFGPTDPGQVIRETSVAVYKDGFYLGRVQGTAMEMADLERVEVFRGPQATMFGRNATGGAVNLVSKKPSGEWNFRQTVSYGNFDALRSVTTVDLPEFSNIKVKLDYIHSERDGWVNNTAPDQADFNAYNKDAGGITLSAALSDALTLDYDLDIAHVEASQNYFQLGVDNIGIIGVEPGRASETRFDVNPLKPSVSKHQMHSLTLTWKASDALTVKSLSSFRKLDEDTFTNFAGAAYFNGITFIEDIEQEQWTQELQVLGSHDRFEWVAGLYYFEEDVAQDHQDRFSLDIFGAITGTPLTPIIPSTTFDALATQDNVPLSIVRAKTKSKAVYGQVAWTPPVLDDRLKMTVGLRYTDDSRTGSRTIVTTQDLHFEGDEVDPLISLDYRWSDNVFTYAKWSTAFKAGGASTRSASFAAYGAENVETFEVGLKADFFDQRFRVNTALFSTNITNAQIDFVDPANITIVETFNASETIDIDGFELELSMVPIPGLVIGMNYTYLDGNMPLQPNPLAGGTPVQFNLPQTPEHAGSLTIDYTFQPLSIGTLKAHIDLTATDEYSFIASGTQDLDSYALINARLTLADIPLGTGSNNLQVSLWGRNLADSEYIVVGFPVGGLAEAEAYGTPRTYGVDLTYKF